MIWQRILGFSVAFGLPLFGNTLDFEQALLKLEQQNRPLKIAEAEVQGKLGDVWQAGLMINPLFFCEVECYGDSGFCRRDNQPEYNVGLTQPIELGGKRSARQNFSSAEVCKAYWDYQALKLRLSKELEALFVTAAASQEFANLAKEQHQIAQDRLKCAAQKSASGKVPLFHEKKATIAYNIVKMGLEKALTDVTGIKNSIAAALSEPCTTFESVNYPFFFIPEPATLCEYEESLENNPELASARMNVYVATKAYEIAQTSRIPDLSLTASVSNANNDGNTEVSLGFTIPLPIFNRNQGNICRASWETHQAEYLQEDLAIRLKIQLRTIYEELIRSYRTLKTLENDIQTCVKDTQESVNEAYKQGKIEQNEWLESQQTCCEIQQQYIESIKDYHLKRVQIETIAPSRVIFNPIQAP